MEEIRWGIIGCGDVAERKSGPAFQQALNSRLVAVMRRDAEKAADFASRHGVPKWYHQADALIHDPEINAIYVATPPSSHEAYAVAALAAGKHVYLEKPMALNSEGAGRIEEQAKNSSGKLVIAHYRRALPLFKKVKELLESHAIGKPLFADLQLLQPPKSSVVAATENNWRINPAISGGGLFHDLAPHQLDIMLHYFGAAGEATGYSANQLKTSEADDFVSGLIRFRSGVQFRGLWSFAAPAAAAADRCEIIGSKGKISFSFFGEAKVVLQQNGQEQSFSFDNPTYIQQPMIEQVIGYFQGKNANPCPAGEAVEVMQLMDAFTAKGTGVFK
ncbi:Gfo/Idh/MocA family protein [Cesiribacter sp. SM1]|uniref:Gfo/Idh/MocA family protein n=1 Tax=Cesiribacter sp. SM1 TaxID=2861196 RepID=UPI001CD6D6CD|nr:Gfo/Idh/MocA family oxidoreductase [Cesiribacter sp. SM1]